MSKRVVLAGLFLIAGLPMLASDTAPLGAVILLLAITLFALPHLVRRRATY